MLSFNADLKFFEAVPVTGAKGLSHTIANTAVVDNGDDTVTLTLSAAHGLLAGSVVYVEGTTNYNGLREILSIPAATTIRIKAPYVAETPAGTETVKVAIASKRGYIFVGFRLKIGTAPTTSESLTITADSSLGAAWDVKLYDQDLAGITDLIYAVAHDECLPFRRDDILRVAWTNTDARTFGLELLYAPVK